MEELFTLCQAPTDGQDRAGEQFTDAGTAERVLQGQADERLVVIARGRGTGKRRVSP